MMKEEEKENIVQKIRAIEDEHVYNSNLRRRKKMHGDDVYAIRDSQKRELNRPRVRELKTEISSLEDHKARLEQRRVTKTHIEALEGLQFQPKINPRHAIARYIQENYPLEGKNEEEKEEIKRVMKRYTGIEKIPKQFEYTVTGGEYLENLSAKLPRENITKEWETLVKDEFMKDDSSYIIKAVQELKKVQERRDDPLSNDKKVLLSTIAQVTLNVNLIVPPHYDSMLTVPVPNPLYDSQIDILLLYRNEREKNQMKEKLFEIENEPCNIQYMSLYQFKSVNRDKKRQKKLANGIDLVLVDQRYWHEVYRKKHTELLSRRNQVYPINYSNLTEEVTKQIYATRVFQNYSISPIRIPCGQVELEASKIVENIHSILEAIPSFVPHDPLTNITSLSLTMEGTPGLPIYENLFFENDLAKTFKAEKEFQNETDYEELMKRLRTLYEEENDLPKTYENVDISKPFNIKRPHPTSASPSRPAKRKRT